MKSAIKYIITSVVGMVVNTILTMIATKVVDVLYNKFVKKPPMCFVCGGDGFRYKKTDDTLEKVQCDCRKTKYKFWKNLFNWEIT